GTVSVEPPPRRPSASAGASHRPCRSAVSSWYSSGATPASYHPALSPPSRHGRRDRSEAEPQGEERSAFQGEAVELEGQIGQGRGTADHLGDRGRAGAELGDDGVHGTLRAEVVSPGAEDA